VIPKKWPSNTSCTTDDVGSSLARVREKSQSANVEIRTCFSRVQKESLRQNDRQSRTKPGESVPVENEFRPHMTGEAMGSGSVLYPPSITSFLPLIFSLSLTPFSPPFPPLLQHITFHFIAQFPPPPPPPLLLPRFSASGVSGKTKERRRTTTLLSLSYDEGEKPRLCYSWRLLLRRISLLKQLLRGDWKRDVIWKMQRRVQLDEECVNGNAIASMLFEICIQIGSFDGTLKRSGF